MNITKSILGKWYSIESDESHPVLPPMAYHRIYLFEENGIHKRSLKMYIDQDGKDDFTENWSSLSYRWWIDKDILFIDSRLPEKYRYELTDGNLFLSYNNRKIIFYKTPEEALEAFYR